MNTHTYDTLMYTQCYAIVISHQLQENKTPIEVNVTISNDQSESGTIPFQESI